MREPRLLLGPMLRYVDAHAATVWVETDRACVVAVDADGHVAREHTWSVHGHHYALLQLRDLPGAAVLPYTVHLDDALVWPEPESPFPPSVIRTLDDRSTLRLSFGSCRRSAPFDAAGLKEHGADALAALAERMRTEPHERWPDALFLGGDQIYADEPSPALVARLKQAHEPVPAERAEIAEEVWNFEEYTWLYHEAWSPDPVRWLLSTVPTCMLLDDHDLRDDWNTSHAWRTEMAAKPWWRDRVVGAFGSYWVYQHLGNLSPQALEHDAMFAAVRATGDDGARTAELDEFAWRADAEQNTARWSFVRDFFDGDGLVRFVAMDCRASRRLDGTTRSMIDDVEWAWIVEQATEEPVAHLVLGSTLPVMIPRGIHYLEGWNEAVASGRFSPAMAKLGERLRRFVDLEHWSAFRGSFERLVGLFADVASSPRPPSSVLVLSGDVHCSYTADARVVGIEHPHTVIRQLTMSPFRNYLPVPVKLVNKFFEKAPLRVGLRWFSRAFAVPDTGLDWALDSGPWFQNGLMTVVFDGREARLEVDRALHANGRQYLERAGEQVLTTARRGASGAAIDASETICPRR